MIDDDCREQYGDSTDNDRGERRDEDSDSGGELGVRGPRHRHPSPRPGPHYRERVQERSYRSSTDRDESDRGQGGR